MQQKRRSDPSQNAFPLPDFQILGLSKEEFPYNHRIFIVNGDGQRYGDGQTNQGIPGIRMRVTNSRETGADAGYKIEDANQCQASSLFAKKDKILGCIRACINEGMEKLLICDSGISAICQIPVVFTKLLLEPKAYYDLMVLTRIIHEMAIITG